MHVNEIVKTIIQAAHRANLRACDLRRQAPYKGKIKDSYIRMAANAVKERDTFMLAARIVKNWGNDTTTAEEH